MNWHQALLLAGEQPPADKAPAGDPGSIWPILLPFAVIFLMYQLLIARPQRREQAKRDEMLKQLKKNDPVVTIGGIFGTVASLSEDGSEVTVKVDENTRLRVRRDAIREVVAKAAPGDAK